VSLNYLVIRLAQILPTFFLIMVIVFVLVHLLPGDPTSALLGIRATDEAVNRINEQLGLNRPIPVQFLFFLRSFFQGDLGDSIVLKVSGDAPHHRAPAGDPVPDRPSPPCWPCSWRCPWPCCRRCAATASVDGAIRTGFQIGLSMPVFYIGILLLTFFAARLHWFPVGGFGSTFARISITSFCRR
jgi:ABC-type dipeptide/oligopeptide/nickel transport systems, permease components